MSTWDIDPVHSSIAFSVRHLVIAKVHGRFGKYSGTVELDEADVTKSKVAVSIDADSIDTLDAQRDGHLKSPDFFDVATYPTLTFESTSLSKAGARYTLEGKLTIHGVTRPVSLDMEDLGRMKDLYGNDRAAFEAKGHIERKDFGLTWNRALEAGGVAVGDRINISLEIQAIRRKA